MTADTRSRVPRANLTPARALRPARRAGRAGWSRLGLRRGWGVAADPIGYLEIGSEGAAFRPIREPYPSPAVLIASGLAVALVIRALARLIRR